MKKNSTLQIKLNLSSQINIPENISTCQNNLIANNIINVDMKELA